MTIAEFIPETLPETDLSQVFIEYDRSNQYLWKIIEAIEKMEGEISSLSIHQMPDKTKTIVCIKLTNRNVSEIINGLVEFGYFEAEGLSPLLSPSTTRK